MEKWYTCRNDRAFKTLFFNEKNKKLLKLLLEHILKVEIYEITILNNEKARDNIKTKGMRTDLSLNTNIGYINVEVNSNPEEYVHPRNFSYLSDAYSHAISISETYNEEIQYIQINFSYGLMLTENHHMKKEPIDKEAIRVYKVQDNKGKEFIKNFTIYEINMDYYLNLWYNKNTKELEKEKIIVMLGLDKESLEELSSDDKIVGEYMEEMNKINEDPKFREYISYEEDQRKIQNTLLEKAERQGLEKGINSEKIEIAKNSLENNIDIDTIVKITGLKKEEVEKLK